MFVVLGALSLSSPCLRRGRLRSDIDNKAKALRVAPTGLRLCFALGYKHGAPTELPVQFVVRPMLRPFDLSCLDLGKQRLYGRRQLCSRHFALAGALLDPLLSSA